MLTKEIIAICQPTYNDCILQWHYLGLHSETIMPSTEQEWLKDKEYVLKNYKSACAELGLA